MEKPVVVLKNVKFFRGSEGYGVNANVYVNGVKCFFIIDSGNGGMMEFEKNLNPQTLDAVNNNIKLLNDYIKTLPPEEYELHDGKKCKIEITMDTYINNVLIEQERNKENMKMQKLFKTAIVFGVPSETKYSYYNFKKDLSLIPTQNLQSILNTILRKYCNNDIVILNDNLKNLGLTY